MNIAPNQHGDWINQRNDKYLNLRPVAVIQSESAISSLNPVFERSSFGVKTNRDSWVFNSSSEKLRELIERQVAFYNDQVEALQAGANTVVRDPKQFRWDGTAEQRAKRGIQTDVSPSKFRSAVYRPFFLQHFYMDDVLNNSVYQIPAFFPTPDTRNPDYPR